MFTEIQGKKIHYEIHGEGEPVLFLNGIMMDTTSWSIFNRHFARHFQVILLDLVDQGRSDSADELFTHEYHLPFIVEFLNVLKLPAVHILGMSYGGEIAQAFALEHPEKIKSLILVHTTPVIDAYLLAINYLWQSAAKTYDAEKLKRMLYPLIYSRSYYCANPKMMERMVSKKEKQDAEYFDRIIRTLSSTPHFDLVERLPEIKVPTLIIGADEDVITLPYYQQLMHEKIPHSNYIQIQGTGHSSLFEKRELFRSLIIGRIQEYKEAQHDRDR